MKAIVKETLSRKTRHGHLVLTRSFSASKDYIIDEVNCYICHRVHASNFIPVSLFEVKIYDYKNHVRGFWKYIPTYR